MRAIRVASRLLHRTRSGDILAVAHPAAFVREQQSAGRRRGWSAARCCFPRDLAMPGVVPAELLAAVDHEIDALGAPARQQQRVRACVLPRGMGARLWLVPAVEGKPPGSRPVAPPGTGPWRAVVVEPELSEEAKKTAGAAVRYAGSALQRDPGSRREPEVGFVRIPLTWRSRRVRTPSSPPIAPRRSPSPH